MIRTKRLIPLAICDRKNVRECELKGDTNGQFGIAARNDTPVEKHVCAVAKPVDLRWTEGLGCTYSLQSTVQYGGLL